MKLINLSGYNSLPFFEFAIPYMLQSRGYEEISHNVDYVLAHLLRIHPNLDRKDCRSVLLRRQRKLIQEREERKSILVAQFLHLLQLRKKEEAYRLLDESNKAGYDLQCFLVCPHIVIVFKLKLVLDKIKNGTRL